MTPMQVEIHKLPGSFAWAPGIFVAALLLLFACNKESNPAGTSEPGGISGKVLDTNGIAVSGANVFTTPPTVSVLTGVFGEYTIDGVDAGDYLVVAVKGARGTSRSVHVRSGGVTTADLPLEAGNRLPAGPRVTQPKDGGECTVNPRLQWECADPDSDWLHYDVYLDSTSPPRLLLKSDLAVPWCEAPGLRPQTTYYWTVVAKDNHYGVTVGPRWSFRTSIDSSLVGLIAHYPLDGDATDRSVFGNNGQVSGSLATANRNGTPGRALLFDGVNDYVRIPDRPQLHPLRQLTIAVWIRMDSVVNNWSPVIHKGGEAGGAWYNNRVFALLQKAHVNNSAYYCFYSAGDGSIQHEVNTGGTGFPDAKHIAAGEWVFLVCSVDRLNHTMDIWWNSTWRRQVPDSYSTFNPNSNDLMLGWWDESTPENSPFKGVLDDLRIYDRLLSANEIQALYTRFD